MELYNNLKGRAYGAACACSGCDNRSARQAGHKDVFALIMSDSDHPRQFAFLAQIVGPFTEKQCLILLDGLAKEYQKCDGWAAYVERECV